jgi:phage terminase large subunit GpA-like protein
MIQAISKPKNNQKRLCRSIADAWRVKEQKPLPEWVEENVRLPAEFGQPGPYSFDGYEFWKEPLEACEDPETYEIVVQSGTQIGKTEWGMAAIAGLSELDSGPQMFVGPDRDFIHENRDKIYAHAAENKSLKGKIPHQSRWNMRHIDFGDSLCHLAWSGNAQRVSGKAIKVVYCSEVDRFKQPVREGSIAKLIKERVKAWYRYKIIWEGTPTDQNSNISALYFDTDQRRYHVPCPECGHYQELRFFTHKDGPYKGCGGIGGMKDAAGKWIDKDEALTKAFYICEKGCRIDNEEKRWMVANGVWCPKGQSVDRSGKLKEKPLRGPRRRGYQLGSIYSPKITFGRIASEWIDSVGNELSEKNFWNNWMGFKYAGKSKTPNWRILGLRHSGGYKRGTIPPAAFFLVAGVDVQADRCYWVVRAYGEKKSSWLVEWGVQPVKIDVKGNYLENSDLAQLKDLVIERNFPFAQPNPVGMQVAKPILTCVDVNFQSHRVFNWARNWPGDQVRTVAGDHQMKAAFFNKTDVEKTSRDGKVYPGGMERWGINTHHYKSEIQGRWNYSLDETGSWAVPIDMTAIGETYLKHVTSESLQTKFVNGRPVQRFMPSEGRENHWFDCEVYSFAGADMVVAHEWDDLAGQFSWVGAEPAPAIAAAANQEELNFDPR